MSGKYPQQNVAEFVALGHEMERVKRLEGGTAFLCDLMEAIVALEGLVVVDKAEYDELRARAALPAGTCGAPTEKDR